VNFKVQSADNTDEALITRWQAAWPTALEAWSKFTRLRNPQLCRSTVHAANEGLVSSFAMIRLADQRVVVNLQQVREYQLESYAVEVLAHEAGHHVLAPANATDHYRLLARIRRGLPTLERHSAMIANLYTDLLINDRLQRRAGLRMSDVYHRLPKGAPDEIGVWTVYMGIYEALWQVEKGSLGGPRGDDMAESDAWLGARLIRAYAEDWLEGAGRFAALLLPYVAKEHQDNPSALAAMHDTREAANGCEPSGLTAIEEGEASGTQHPADDPRVTGDDESVGDDDTNTVGAAQSAGQCREPFEYGEILKAAGIKLSDHEIALRYYRELALPYLIPFPTKPTPRSAEPLVEGVESWDIGDPLDEIDWLQTITASPRVIPGLTTTKRTFGRTEGQLHARKPIDLDLYVDCSGSMPNPQLRLSYSSLAGAVIILSALRSGSRVQATLWSGKRQIISTPGFVRDQDAVLRVLTGYLGGSTAFPIHKLRDTHAMRNPTDRACHILLISDEGITTMFDADEHGTSGWDIAARALAAGRAGGTMALNIAENWAEYEGKTVAYDDLKRAQKEQNWDIHAINRQENLLTFARAFVQRHYVQKPGSLETPP